MPGFRHRASHYAGGEMLADEQRLLAGFRTRAHDRVLHRLHFGNLFRLQRQAPRIARTQLLELGQIAVFGTHVLHSALERVGQGLPCKMLIGEQRCRCLHRGSSWACSSEPRLGVALYEWSEPVVAGIAQADRFNVPLDVGYHQRFRMPAQLEIKQHGICSGAANGTI